MKYLFLIYGNSENWTHPMYLRHPDFLALPADERAEISRRADELFNEVRSSGEFVVGSALADPTLARTARADGGMPAVTDGPYLEAKEQLAGYFVLDCETPERAAELAKRFPDARFAAVEVRPIMQTTGQDM